MHLFAGAGGGILADILLGHQPVCAVENNAYCQQVISARQRDGTFPWFPIWDDIRTFNGKSWRGKVDIVAGGFPCQAWSTAAAGNNVAENMWPEMLRVVGQVEPCFVFAENVDEGAILMAQKDLANCGYQTKRLKLSASDVGADHLRVRWWLFANAYHKSKLGGTVNAEMAEFPQSCCSFWQTKPVDTRMDDGMADRTHRFKAIGNGEVPVMAAIAWKILSQKDVPKGRGSSSGESWRTCKLVC